MYNSFERYFSNIEPIISIIGMLCGLGLLFYGLRIYKIILGITGGIMLGILTAAYAFAVSHEQSAFWIGMLAGGVIGYAIAWSLFKLCIFLLYGALGAILTVVSLGITVGRVEPTMAASVGFIAFIVFGGVAVWIMERYLALLLSAIGAFLLLFDPELIIHIAENHVYSSELTQRAVAWLALTTFAYHFQKGSEITEYNTPESITRLGRLRAMSLTTAVIWLVSRVIISIFTWVHISLNDDSASWVIGATLWVSPLVWGIFFWLMVIFGRLCGETNKNENMLVIYGIIGAAAAFILAHHIMIIFPGYPKPFRSIESFWKFLLSFRMISFLFLCSIVGTMWSRASRYSNERSAGPA